MTALETVRQLARSDARPPIGVRFVDWADEEGARFGRSLLGSSAASGSLQVNDVRDLIDKQATPLPEALRENGVDIDRMLDAHAALKAIQARAYLELHIEQGPVLESMNKATGVVLGTFGVERHMLRFTGQAAHSGSTPIPMRRDAFLAAAETAIELARNAGIGWVGVRGSNHAGSAGVYAAMALPHGMVGIYSVVASANHMPVWGGVESLLGTNPVAIAIPAGEEAPIVLDIAT